MKRGFCHMITISHSEKETEELGARLAKVLQPGTAVIALYGDLGAGKTALVRGLARGLGVRARVTSPTFSIVNELRGSRELFHFDMYRLKGAEDLFVIGWEDYLARGGVCAVEWSENVQEAFDGSEITVRLEKLSDTERKISVEGAELC